jgi:putative Holliday junction resolvase
VPASTRPFSGNCTFWHTLLPVRALGVDLGRRRIGLARSDASGILATPWRALAAGASPRDSAGRLAALLEDEAARDASLLEVDRIVVGLPRRLSGEETDQSAEARLFAKAIAELTGLAVHLQDERLTSREAESRLAIRERDWRVRKARLDAAAAAIILQDYLDAHQPEPPDQGD